MNNEHADTALPSAFVTDSMDPDYGIRIDINYIRPKDPSFFDRHCTRGGKIAFIVGKRFDIGFQLINVSHRTFPGGELLLSVRWTGKREPDWYRIEIPPLSDGEATEPDKRDYSAIESGYGMIFARVHPYSDSEHRERSSRFSCYLFFKDMNLGDIEAHVGSLFAQTQEEFYQLWAMLLAAIGLSYILIKDIIGLLLSWIPPLCSR